MDLLVDVVAVVTLSGVIAMTVLVPAIALGMPMLLVVGLIDGPSGGRLEARRARRVPERSTAAVHRVTAPGHEEPRVGDPEDRPAA